MVVRQNCCEYRLLFPDKTDWLAGNQNWDEGDRQDEMILYHALDMFLDIIWCSFRWNPFVYCSRQSGRGVINSSHGRRGGRHLGTPADGPLLLEPLHHRGPDVVAYPVQDEVVWRQCQHLTVSVCCRCWNSPFLHSACAAAGLSCMESRDDRTTNRACKYRRERLSFEQTSHNMVSF